MLVAEPIYYFYCFDGVREPTPLLAVAIVLNKKILFAFVACPVGVTAQ